MQSKLTLIVLLLLGAAGITAQPILVEDIYPGDDGRPSNFFNYNGQLIFRAETEAEGRELWISDGTVEGTMLVKDINPDPGVAAGNSNPDNFVLYNGLVYFKAEDATTGDEFWVTDGTAAGTNRVVDIQPGDGNGNPFDIVLFNDLIYFTANNGNDANSSELWSSDGTEAGTMMVIDIFPGGGPGNPINKTVIGDFMYFAANDGINGVELWRTDGTAAGTELIKDIREGSGNSLPSRFTEYNGEVYFRANDGMNGNELWKTDGTAEGTVLVKDIAPGSSSASPDDLFVFGDLLYFVADDDVNGDELWVTDGTEEGTMMVADINPVDDSDPDNFLQIVPTFVFFTATDTTHGEELWFMSIEDGDLEIGIFEDIVEGNVGSEPDDLVWTGSALYFSAETADFGRELYQLSVDDDEPVRISDINPGPTSSDIDDIFQVDNRLFFEANDGTNGDELWTLAIPLPEITMLSSAGTELVVGDTIDLGDVIVGFNHTDSVQILSSGMSTLVLVENNLDGSGTDFSFNFNFFPINDLLPAGETEIIAVTFSPTVEGEQFFSAVITTEAANVTDYHLVFRGNGIPAVAAVSVVDPQEVDIQNGGTLDFGEVIIDQDSTIVLVIQNEGNINLELSDLTVTGDAFSAGAVPGLILPGNADTLSVHFAPTAEGQVSGLLSFVTNDVNNATYEINLAGIGLMDTGLRELTTSEIGVFPNPVSDRLVLRLAEGLPETELMIYDARGQLLRRTDAGTIQTGFSLDVSQLPAGHYLLEVRNAEARGVTKFVKR